MLMLVSAGRYAHLLLLTLTIAIANFGVLCTVKADVTAAVSRLVPRRRADGRTYVQLEYEVVLLFGLTELKAQLRWFANVCS